MPTPVLICGFECGVLGAAPHWASGAAASIVTSGARSGSRALRCNPSAQKANLSQNIPNLLGTVAVVRLYVRFATLPDADVMIVSRGSGTGVIGIGFDTSTSKIHCASPKTSSTTIEFAGAGFAVETGVWYCIDVKMDGTPGAKTVDAVVTIDGEESGTTLTQMASTSANAAGDDLWLGTGPSSSNFPTTGDWYYDDINVSNTGGDYPLGTGFVNHFIPTSDGTHNITAADRFERGNTGTDVTNATTTAYQLVDDLPIPSGTPDAADCISVTEPGDADEYVELKFGLAPGVSNPSAGPTAIDVIVAWHQSGGDVVHFALNDNGSLDDILNGIQAGSDVIYTRKIYTNPPSAASSWGITAGNGDITNVRLRLYSSDELSFEYHLDGLLIEAEFDAIEPAPPPGGYYACAGTLPTFLTADQDKIDALRVLRATPNEPIEAYELVKISWPSPDGDIYYAVLQTDEIASVAPPISPIETRLIPDGNPDWFLPVQIDHSIGDEEVDLEFFDGDGVISDLLVDHGEGVKVELYYWFPQVELLLPIWHGHLRQEDEAEIDRVRLKAVQGFRSSEGLLPRRAHYRECQAPFGGIFDTQDEIDEHDCPYNKHIGGSIGNFISGSTPYTSCPRRTRQDCIDRLGNSGNYMLSHATASVIVANNQTKGSRLFSTSQGNETNLKDPVCVVMGVRRVRGMLVVAYRKDLNNNNPENGFIFLIGELCEGPIESLSYAEVYFGSDSNPADPFNFNYRLGDQGQTAMDSALTVHSYSGTVLIRARSGWVDPETVDISSVSGSAIIYGLNNIRVYTDADTYTEEWTDNRAWHILKMLTDKRWGYGYDYERIDIPSFIEAACWCANYVQFVDENGDEWNHIRALSNVELRGRKVQQQVEDMCMAGRLSRPFLFNGKIHIVPLREMTSAELAAAMVFTDEGSSRNIIWEDGKTSLKRERTSDLDLPNRIECTFDDAEDDYVERPARPVEDIDAQLRAGRVVGDKSQKINVKKYGLTGVVVEAQAIKMATALRDLGPFDEGGLVNNLRLKFKIWFIDSLNLFPTKVIKVESSVLTRYGFEYFRVISMKRMGNLHVELTVQAYNETYMATFEELYGGIDPIPDDPDPPDSGSVAPPTDPLVFNSVSYSSGILTIDFEATP